MTRHFVSTMIAFCCALAFVACKENVPSDGGAGGTGAVSTGGSGGTGGTGAVGGTGGTGGTDTADFFCIDCACDRKSGDVDPGCADTCDSTISGQPTPNFCNGAPALSQCEACIMQRCGATSATCN